MLKVPHKNVVTFGNVVIIMYFCSNYQNLQWYGKRNNERPLEMEGEKRPQTTCPAWRTPSGQDIHTQGIREEVLYGNMEKRHKEKDVIAEHRMKLRILKCTLYFMEQKQRF